EEDKQRQPGPHINRRYEDSALWLARDRAPGKSKKAVNDKGQRQNHQRIQLKGRDWMQVQQLITGARRSAAGTLIASEQKKWALRKPLVGWTGRIEEKQKDRSRGNRHPSRRRNGKLSSTIGGDVNKMKIRHDQSRLRSNVEAVFAVNPIYVEISIQRKNFFHT